MEPTDLDLSVELANGIVERSSRPVQWISHAGAARPKGRRIFRTAKEAAIVAYDRALSRAIHLTDGVAGARSRVETAKRYRPEFGVACECGFGRRNPETVLPLLDLHREVAAL